MKRGLAVVFVALLVGMSIFLFKPQIVKPAVETLSNNVGLTQAEGFLGNLFDSSIGLCRETLVGQINSIMASNGTLYRRYTNETYWIASDNYLESLALRQINVPLSGTINETCGKYYNGSYFPYQIMQGEAIPLTLHIPNIYILENASDHIIPLNLYNGTVDLNNTYLDYPTCGDALVYEALNYYVQGYPFDWCKGLYMEAYNMFDGKGVADAHFLNTSEYDNMKLALLIFGEKVLNLGVNLTGIEQQLWNAQNTGGVEVGGFRAVDDIEGNPIRTANGETTAFALLAFDGTIIARINQARTQKLVNGTEDSLDVTFPATNYNQTSVETKLTAIPLLDNWTVTMNNTVQWETMDSYNPRILQGFYSNLASCTSLSIQIVEYNNSVLDIVVHNVTCPGGCKIASINWSNPLTISLINNTLTVSSPAYTFEGSFPDFPLEYITAGSTESHISNNGEVDIQVIPEFSRNLLLPLFMIVVPLVALAHKRKPDN